MYELIIRLGSRGLPSDTGGSSKNDVSAPTLNARRYSESVKPQCYLNLRPKYASCDAAMVSTNYSVTTSAKSTVAAWASACVTRFYSI